MFGRRKEPAELLAGSYEGVRRLDERSASIEHRGRELIVRFVERRLGSHSHRFTEVELWAENEGFFASIVPVDRPEAPSRNEVARGLATDVKIGVEAIDLRFVIDAAPPAVARHLLTHPPVLDALLSVWDVAIHATEGGWVVDRPWWPDDPAPLSELITLVSDLADRLPEAEAEARRDAERGDAGPEVGYRGASSAASSEAAEAAARAVRRRRERLTEGWLPALIMTLLALAAAAAAVWAR
jgi:hypothetical protein